MSDSLQDALMFPPISDASEYSTLPTTSQTQEWSFMEAFAEDVQYVHQEPIYRLSPDPFTQLMHHHHTNSTIDPASVMPSPIIAPLPTTRIRKLRGRRTAKDDDPRRKHACQWEGCVERFIRKEHLNRHMLAHTREMSHFCTQCQRAFTRNDNMLSHMRSVHENPSSETSCD